MKKYDIVDYKNEDGVISPYEVLFTFHIKEEKVDCAVIFPKVGNGQTDLEIVTYKYENEKLIQLRDTLLPKLMSGEIDVSNVDISTDKLSFSEK